MAREDWELAELVNPAGALGSRVPSGEISVPSEIAIDGTNLVYGRPSRRVTPNRKTLNAFVRLWQRGTPAVLAFAKRWGVLSIDREGRPASRWVPAPPREPLEEWRYFSKRACAVLNIAASVKLRKLADLSDWEALKGTASHTGDFVRELSRFESGTLSSPAVRAYPFDANDPMAVRTVQNDAVFLNVELMLWLRLGRVGFAIARDGNRWKLEVDYGGNLLSAIAMQLALCVAGVEALYVCSGCNLPYFRHARKTPKTGEDNYCEECGRDASTANADRRRRERERDARRMHTEGKSLSEIAKSLDAETASVRRWITKGKVTKGKDTNGQTRKR